MRNQLETLLIGGSGKTGRRVETRLRAKGVPVRVASRSAANRFDWNDESTWEPALGGARAVYITFYPDLAVPWAAERVGKLARLAAARGAERLVLLSGRGEHQVWPAERAVREAGAAFTIVRSAFFCQNFSEGALVDGVLHGELAFPAGEVREPFVDAEDVADVVAAALTDERHAGQIYDLTGPELLSFHDAVVEISRVSGRSVRYVPVSGAAYGELLAPFLPAEEASFLVDLFGMLLDGHNSLLTDGVERALGRKPRDFASYARDAASVWR
ncbi:MAG: NmrA family transcriptional regulator [Myxococcales bacterium]|nr:MAG: NmrA family transcriptional regulator [Myxococcales bacterium]